MRRRHPVSAIAVTLFLVATPMVQVAGTIAARASSNTTYTPDTPLLDTVENGPWTLSQGDQLVGNPYSESLPRYTPGGTPTQSGGYPNLAVYPDANAPTGTPYATGVAGTPGPVDAYCTSGGAAPETGSQAEEPSATTLATDGYPNGLPMSPYYFPFVMQTPDDSTQGHLTGFFDYRPKDTEEAIVVGRSTDGGQSWNFVGQVLQQNPANYCPTGDSNDNGQGHPFVATVGTNAYLYTVNRPAGDNVGVGLLVHPVNLSASNPVASLPANETVGTDPDTFASAGTSVPTSTGTPVAIPVSTLGTGAEIVGPGQFEDLNATTPSASVISCTGSNASTPIELTGCTTAGSSSLSVSSGDPLVQVLADASVAVTIPEGPNSSAENGGSTIDLNAALGAIAAANVPGRFYVDGATIYCVNLNGASTALENCTTTKSGGVSVSTGDAVTTDPILPSDTGHANGAEQTTGLIAPDGIVGTIPSSVAAVGYPSAPSGSTVVIYGEKILNYYIEGTVTTTVALSTTTPYSVTMTPSTTPTAPLSSGSNTIYLGSTAGLETVTCGTYAAPTFSNCLGGSGSVASGNDVGGPGAAIASSSVLGAIGEGSTKPKTLFKNNEDLTVLRAAWTTNGVDFTDLGQISGASGGASSYSDVNNPAAQAYPATVNLAAGATDTPELRYVGTRGTIIVNPDGSLGMFDSGAWESDGDSDAFDQIFYSSSTDGVHWTEPVVIESTDYTFSARQQQDAALAGGSDTELGISAYFAGRAYSPTVVQNPDGTLTMVFSGYSTPKPIPVVGSTLGDGQPTCGTNGTTTCPTWTVEANDPALYRNILTVTLSPVPGTSTPESPSTVLLPILGAALVGAFGAFEVRRRRARRGHLVMRLSARTAGVLELNANPSGICTPNQEHALNGSSLPNWRWRPFCGDVAARPRRRLSRRMIALVVGTALPIALFSPSLAGAATTSAAPLPDAFATNASALGFGGSPVFSDDFSGTSLNTANWDPGIASKSAGGMWNESSLPGGYVFSSEGSGGYKLQYFSSQNITVNNGLTLSAVPDTSEPGYSYRSAAVSTYGKDPVSGTVLWEIDAKTPDCSSGMWPGIWFLPDSTALYPPGQLGDAGEIDLFEGGYTQGSANPNTVMAVHYGGATTVAWQAPSSYPIVPDLSAGYHVYGLKFVPGVSITYYLDGQQVWQTTSNVSSYPYELILDLEVASSQTIGWHTLTSSATPSVSDFDIADVAEYSTTHQTSSAATPSTQLPEASSAVMFPIAAFLGVVVLAIFGRRRKPRAPVRVTLRR